MKRLILASLLVSGLAQADWPYTYGKPMVIQNTYNPLQSYTILPQGNGRTIIRNTYNPLESYTYQKRLFGETTIQETYNPLNSWTIR